MDNVMDLIFSEIYGDIPASRQMEKEIDQEMKQLAAENEGIDSDVLFAASGIGQQYGFYGGFSFALKLLIECGKYWG